MTLYKIGIITITINNETQAQKKTGSQVQEVHIKPHLLAPVLSSLSLFCL
jgi:hypothetical protein